MNEKFPKDRQSSGEFHRWRGAGVEYEKIVTRIRELEKALPPIDEILHDIAIEWDKLKGRLAENGAQESYSEAKELRASLVERRGVLTETRSAILTELDRLRESQARMFDEETPKGPMN